MTSVIFFNDPMCVFKLDASDERREMCWRLTLLITLIARILQRQADRTVVPRAVLPVGDDLSGGCTVSHWRERERNKNKRQSEKSERIEASLYSQSQERAQIHSRKLCTIKDKAPAIMQRQLRVVKLS